jgi:hypothetical protein
MSESRQRLNQRLLTGILGFADPACCTVPITGCSPYAADCTGRLTSVTALPRETLRPAAPVRLHPWSVLLRLTALAVAGVGITMNGWYSRSLGSTEAAGYLFLAVGVAADAVALCLPSVLDRAWQAHQRVTAAAGWLVWAITFVFAETAGIGFGSVNISILNLGAAPQRQNLGNRGHLAEET